MSLKCYNPWSGELCFSPEKNSRVDDVVRDGYIDTSVRVSQLIAAGEKLMESRGAQYDFAGDADVDIDDYECDPTRDPRYEDVDACVGVRDVMPRVEFQIAAAKKAADEKKAADKQPEEKATE